MRSRTARSSPVTFMLDRPKSERATKPMLQMKKLDIARLQKAYDGVA
jgi:hypothetical protein